MKIEPTTKFIASHCQGTIHATKAQIIKVLGFKPNVEDDPDKVVSSWGFTIDGEPAAIWDYRGSHRFNQYSYFNPKVPDLFNHPEKVVLSITKRTTHLVGARRTGDSKTLLSIPFIGGNIVIFAS